MGKIWNFIASNVVLHNWFSDVASSSQFQFRCLAFCCAVGLVIRDFTSLGDGCDHYTSYSSLPSYLYGGYTTFIFCSFTAVGDSALVLYKIDGKIRQLKMFPCSGGICKTSVLPLNFTYVARNLQEIPAFQVVSYVNLLSWIWSAVNFVESFLFSDIDVFRILLIL